MSKAFFVIPEPKNEPVLAYTPDSPERKALTEAIKSLKSQQLDIPMVIGGEAVRSAEQVAVTMPHNHQHVLGHYHRSDEGHIEQAINAALNAKEDWEALSWEHRASIFLKAADLLAGPWRARINAATMLGQSKNAYQAEIDAACETIDFFRFNAAYMAAIYKEQPYSPTNTWNRMEYRALEGFVYAVTPFNFTSIAANLPTAPALMGNTVVWKPSPKQAYSAHFLMQLFMEAGLPPGVINLVYDQGPLASKIVFDHPQFAGIHYTGSTGVFKSFWKTIGDNIDRYKSYPRIVGETGGKDFIIAHASADAGAVATAIVRGGFEFQGQKCSAVSRVYLPDNLWPDIQEKLLVDAGAMAMGDVEDFGNFVNAVIDEHSFDKIAAYIEKARESKVSEIIAGGNYDKSKGYFIEPTIVLTEDPHFVTMQEEIFGPVVTIYVYQASRFEEALYLVDNTSPYALTGAVFAQDRYSLALATQKLTHAAGNFYINDKPTGAVVGQQPFGGARASGTNDKAGSMLNLLRWTSPRAIKENMVSPTDFRYPFMG
jgi:1-pyrroline-5-carboxylate dehydrogenase